MMEQATAIAQMTVKELFEKAGHPIGRGDEIYCRPGNDDVLSLWWTNFGGMGDESLIMVFDEISRPTKWVNLHDVHSSLRDFYDKRSGDYGINLANLPVKDCRNVLPVCIRQAEKE